MHTKKNKHRHKTKSLGAKFIALVAIILGLTLSIATAIIIYLQANERQEILADKATMLGEFVALISPESMLAMDLVALNEYMIIISKQKDIVYGEITGSNGYLLSNYLSVENFYVKNAIEQHERMVGEIANEAFTEKQVRTLISMINAGTDIVDLEFPIMFDNEILGRVRIAYTTHRIDEASKQFLYYSLMSSSALIIFLAYCIYIVFKQGALRPIQHLADGAKRIVAGNFEERVKFFTNNELGQLTLSFNDMMDRLKESIAEKDDAIHQMAELNKNLEKRVIERTQKLADSDARVRAIVSAAPEAIISLDDDGFIDSINPAAERIFNMGAKNIIGLHSSRLISKQDSPRFSHIMQATGSSRVVLTAKHENSVYELEGKRFDGSFFPMELVVNPMIFDGKNMYICIMRDVTKRKEMENSLAEAQHQLMESAHQAGMAEIATGVLHNIGNILNSVNISSEQIMKAVKSSKVSGLMKANALLDEHLDCLGDYLMNDPKGKMLPQYYFKLSHMIQDEIYQIGEETTTLMSKIGMMKEVIHTQQSYAKGGFLTERCMLTSLIDDAIAIQQQSLYQAGVSLSRNYQFEGQCIIHKSKLIQVMTNLIKNGKEAMQSNDLQNKSKKLMIETKDNEDGTASLLVTDNGIGVQDKNLKKIFNHGFTTKVDGHGFGLHMSANSMTEMQGSLSVTSRGKDKGTTFIITVPIAKHNTDNMDEAINKKAS